MAFDPRLRSARERQLFPWAVAFSAACWLALTVTVIGILYSALLLLFVLMAHALFLAHIRGNGVRLSERQLPALFARCKDIAVRLGLPRVPEVYLVQSDGVRNAFATKLLSRHFVVLYSDLVDQCHDPRQLDFVIAHEMGHLAAGHLKWQAFLLPFRILPLLGASYSRACEYTCDRCGHFVVGDLEQCMRGLVVLAAGGRHASDVDLEAFMAQREETGQLWMAVWELVSSHPYLCKRVAALKEWTAPGAVPRVPRNALAYPLAPLLGIPVMAPAVGGVMWMVALIGMLGAVAVPAFIKYQQRARAADAIMKQAPKADEGSELPAR